ncbi:metal-dependent hydrolase [Luteolibacter flavescens]|uniref:Metal-dependent hydrolase n=1 Tax=Luteolibacter flavescens TaxID=1859460 RepID=A0ABT3FPA7_9BACT|nr:metal-dependent hydrolase [Luteolibacter flavescens]MCW1885096.1 metal-dependent hydrolase [Luteolibacter flavescens]
MDSLTQLALGAVVGELVLGRQLGRRSIAWGALFGTLPDLDVVFAWVLPTAGDLVLHRGISHSIFLIGLLTWLLSKPLANRWKKDKVTRQRAAWFIFLAWGTHVLIDVFTVYGTGVLDPLPLPRVSTDNLAIIDPIFTIPLLVAVIIGLFVKPKEWKKGKGIRAAAWCTGISSFYVILSIWAKFSVSRAVEADLARREVTWQRKMEAPTIFNIMLWRALVDRPGEIWVGYRSVFDPADQPIRWTVVPKREEVIAAHADAREVKIVKWFSKNWLIARESADGIWLADMRFAEMRSWDERGVAFRYPFTWTFEPGSSKDRLRYQGRDARDPAEMLRRMGRRITGENGAWEGNARMIAPVLSLQEYLESR